MTWIDDEEVAEAMNERDVLRAERDKLQERLEAALDIHQSVRIGLSADVDKVFDYKCGECWVDAPCPTQKALSGIKDE